MIGVDYVGVATVITACGSAVAAVIAAVMSNKTAQHVKTRNGDPRTLGEIATDVASAVNAEPPPDERSK